MALSSAAAARAILKAMESAGGRAGFGLGPRLRFQQRLAAVATAAAASHRCSSTVASVGSQGVPAKQHQQHTPFSQLLQAAMAAVQDGNLFASKVSMTLELARRIAAAAREEAQRNGWTVVVSVLDDGANLVYLERMDGTQVGSVQVSQDKAATAVRFKRPSKVYQDMILGGQVHVQKLTGCLPMEGGLPLFVNGQIIGAIGISGVTSAQDGVCAQAGVSELEKLCKLHAAA